MSVESLVHTIENNAEVASVANVLSELEQQGLLQASIASGWTRGWLTDTPRSDIDIAYVGDVHYQKAQEILLETVNRLNLSQLDWDLKGIWNAQLACPEITTTVDHYLVHYVCSVDSVYLAADGKLHDPTGFGFQDAQQGILRMNDYEIIDFDYQPNNIVYLCLEGCRRVAKFAWQPTDRSLELIQKGLPFWERLTDKEKQYFYEKKIIKKFAADKWDDLAGIYEQFGWGFIFAETRAYLRAA